MTQHLDEHKDGVAAYGQNSEAFIMVEEVSRWLMGSGPDDAQPLNILKGETYSLTSRGNPESVFYIPMHDGWLGIARDEMLIGKFVRDRFYEATQFWVTITKTNLATGEEGILLQGRPPVGLEPVTIHG